MSTSTAAEVPSPRTPPNRAINNPPPSSPKKNFMTSARRRHNNEMLAEMAARRPPPVLPPVPGIHPNRNQVRAMRSEAELLNPNFEDTPTVPPPRPINTSPSAIPSSPPVDVTQVFARLATFHIHSFVLRARMSTSATTDAIASQHFSLGGDLTLSTASLEKAARSVARKVCGQVSAHDAKKELEHLWGKKTEEEMVIAVLRKREMGWRVDGAKPEDLDEGVVRGLASIFFKEGRREILKLWGEFWDWG